MVLTFNLIQSRGQKLLFYATVRVVQFDLTQIAAEFGTGLVVSY